MATGSYDNTAIIWDLNIKNDYRKLESQLCKICYVSISPDCEYISTGS